MNNHYSFDYDELHKIFGYKDNKLSSKEVFPTVRLTDIVKYVRIQPTDGNLINEDYRISLPANMIVLGDLDLRGGLTSVPDFCTVKGDLYLYKYEGPCCVRNLNVSGHIYIIDSPEFKLSGAENNFIASFLDIEPCNINLDSYFSIGPDHAFPGVGIMNVHHDIDQFRQPTVEYLKNAYYGPDNTIKKKSRMILWRN